MADSAGLDRTTGEPLTDWGHVRQSIATILTTPLGSRVMRRDFGSEVPDLIDQATTPRNILRVYAAAYVALAKWEPRFKLTALLLRDAGPDGRVSLTIAGQYMPRGHLGDTTVADTVTFGVAL